MLVDRGVKVIEIVEMVNTSEERIQNILNEAWGNFQSDRCRNKNERVNSLDIYQCNPKELAVRDCWWYFDSSLRAKNERKIKTVGFIWWACPKQGDKTVLSASKVMSAVFWNSQDIVLIDHCWPDFTKNSYFSNMNKWVARKKLSSNEEVIAETKGYLDKLENRWTKYIDWKGDYPRTLFSRWFQPTIILIL